jgi:hypothetical protein
LRRRQAEPCGEPKQGGIFRFRRNLGEVAKLAVAEADLTDFDQRRCPPCAGDAFQMVPVGGYEIGLGPILHGRQTKGAAGKQAVKAVWLFGRRFEPVGLVYLWPRS